MIKDRFCSHCLTLLAQHEGDECNSCWEVQRNLQYMDIPTIVNILQKVGKFEQVKNYVHKQSTTTNTQTSNGSD